MSKTYRESWYKVLPYAVLGYNVTKHRINGVAPFVLMYSCDVNTINMQYKAIANISQLREATQHTAKTKRQSVLNKINKSRKPHTFKVGDIVKVHNFKKGKMADRVLPEDYRIIRIIGNKIFRLQDSCGCQITRSIKHIAKTSYG